MPAAARPRRPSREATYGDFAGGPLVDGAPEIVVSAAPA
jgi:hypothetical protein